MSGTAIFGDLNGGVMSCLYMKSAAHLKQFLEKTDDSLMVAHATSGVRSKLAGLRRRLRDETSLPVPPALSCGSGPSCCGDMDCTSGIPALAGCPPNEVTKPPPPKKKRKPPSCPECKKANRDTTGHSYHQEGTRATMRYVCSHPSCPRHRSLMATVEAAPKQKRKYS